jgi:shikimate kinase
MNIVLIGYRGTGKSTVGKILAEQLARKLVSTDGEIMERAQRSIPDIVEQAGWDHFRDLESEVCRELSEKDGLVIDTGGGAILRPENVAALKKHGVVFWLTADVPVIAQRIGGDTQRPSLTGSKSFLEEIEEVLKDRRPKYEAAADHIIPTDAQSAAQVAAAIVVRLETAGLLI